jgi:hypothetical protein
MRSGSAQIPFRRPTQTQRGKLLGHTSQKQILRRGPADVGLRTRSRPWVSANTTLNSCGASSLFPCPPRCMAIAPEFWRRLRGSGHGHKLPNSINCSVNERSTFIRLLLLTWQRPSLVKMEHGYFRFNALLCQ